MEKKKQKQNKTSSTIKKVADTTISTVKQNPKILLIAGGVIIGGYLLTKILSTIVGQVTKTISPDLTTNVNPGGVQVNPNRTTITTQQAKIFAQQLLDAMNQLGTDTGTIKNIFKKINAEDYKLIFNEFGLVDYNGFGVPNDNIFVILDSFQKRDLTFWLRSELNSLFDSGTFKIVKNIITQAGFAF